MTHTSGCLIPVRFCGSLSWSLFIKVDKIALPLLFCRYGFPFLDNHQLFCEETTDRDWDDKLLQLITLALHFTVFCDIFATASLRHFWKWGFELLFLPQRPVHPPLLTSSSNTVLLPYKKDPNVKILISASFSENRIWFFMSGLKIYPLTSFYCLFLLIFLILWGILFASSSLLCRNYGDDPSYFALASIMKNSSLHRGVMQFPVIYPENIKLLIP